MPSEAQLTEEKVLKACDAYRNREYATITDAADAFDAPRQRVSRRLRGIPSEITKGGNNKLLLPHQEQALCDYIVRLDNLGMSPRLSMVRSAANGILRRAHQDITKPPVVGPDWPQRFLDRYPEFVVRKKKPISIHRKEATD